MADDICIAIYYQLPAAYYLTIRFPDEFNLPWCTLHAEGQDANTAGEATKATRSQRRCHLHSYDYLPALGIPNG